MNYLEESNTRQTEVGRVLLDGGADVQMKTGTGGTTSMAAAVAGHSEIVALL